MKKFLIVMIIFTMIFSSGCFDSREINNMTYVMAIGVDKGNEGDNLKLTLQFSIPTAKEDKDKDKGGGKEESPNITTIEAPTIFSGINMVNSYMSKQINLSHAKLIVFSEELAKEGIYKYIDAILRSREIRGSTYIAVSRTSAENFLMDAGKKMPGNPAKEFEANFRKNQYIGFSTNSQIMNFYKSQQSGAVQGVASLAGINSYKKSEEFDLSKSTAKEKGRDIPLDGDYKAGDLPKISSSKVEIMGIAVFDGSKMVGQLDGFETTMYLMATGKYKSSYITFKDPKFPTKYVVLKARQSRGTEKKVDISGSNLKIKMKIFLEADIAVIQSGFKYEEPSNTAILEKATEEYIEKEMNQFLTKTTEKFKSDIVGFGKIVKGKFLGWDEWKDYEWLSKYKDSSFDVSVDLKIRRPGLIIRSLPSISSKGEEQE